MFNFNYFCIIDYLLKQTGYVLSSEKKGHSLLLLIIYRFYTYHWWAVVNAVMILQITW
jgi:hypothetical protein